MQNFIKQYMQYCKGLKLLYVEDNEEARLFTMEMLGRFFDDISVAKNGEEGLALFKEKNFDLVLTDINMPKMNGLDMVKAIRDINNSIAILVLSAHNETDYFLTSIKLNIDGYLLKPIEMNQFIETLGKTVEKIHLRNEVKKYQKELEAVNISLEAKVEERTSELVHRLYYDHLTELQNHLAIMEQIKHSRHINLFLIDISGFHKLNDLYGLNVGNTILKKFAEYLQVLNFNNHCTIYRVHGDVFALYCDENSILDISIEQTKHNLLTHLETAKIYVKEIDEEIDIETTVGVSIDEENSFIKADMALKHAKKENKQIVVYSKEINNSEHLSNHIYWKSEIKIALQNDNIIPVFQSIVDKNGKILKYESLMRLVRYEDGQEKIITPFSFLNTAIETKQYNKLTRIMIQKVFEIMTKFTVDVSINLSFEDLSDPILVQFLEDMILKYGIGERLIVEVLESEMISNYEIVEDAIKTLRQYGTRVAIDDFGSGFSNFERILKLNPDFIKIDGSLVKNILEDENSFTLVKAISEFSKELGVEVIAEFVSSKEIFEKLLTLSIDYFQGFYFSMPDKEIKAESIIKN